MSSAHNHHQARLNLNDFDKGNNTHMSDQMHSSPSTITVATNNPPGIQQPVQDHPANGEETLGANDNPPPHLSPQSAPLDTKAESRLDDEDATDTKGGGDDIESEETDSDDDEGDEEGDEDEPALKYERFGGAFQDLLKKDSASALTVSARFLVRGHCPESRSDLC